MPNFLALLSALENFPVPCIRNPKRPFSYFLLFFLLEKYRGPLLGQFPDVSLYKMKRTTQFISKQNKVLVLFQINMYLRILQLSYCFQAKTSIPILHLRCNLGLDASLCLGSCFIFSFQIADLVSLTANRS